MPNLRVLITGASGFLGGHLCVVAGREADVVGAYHAHKAVPAGTNTLQFDLTNEQVLVAKLVEVQPHVVIHAAVAQVDVCEHDPVLAERLNVHASKTIAEWCDRMRRRMVYISSDLVFDGARGRYVEADTSRPVMIYGCTKLAAEQAVLAQCPGACVARLPLMYGFPARGGSNFFMSMLTRLQRGECVAVFHDQYRTPGSVENLAEAVWELARSDFRGVIHVAGTTHCSRYEMARLVCRFAHLDEALLQSLSMFELPSPAPRPRDVSLNCALAQSFLHTRLFGIEEGLQRIFRPQARVL